MENARKRLESKGVRPTYQRMAVLSFLLGNKTHPSVDDIYEKLLRDIPTISKTTVYNTLQMLAMNGLVSQLNIFDSQAHYDGFTEPHHHFLCESCGKLIDLMIKCPNAEMGCVMGHKINEVHGYFKGVCKDCLNKERRK